MAPASKSAAFPWQIGCLIATGIVVAETVYLWCASPTQPPAKTSSHPPAAAVSAAAAVLVTPQDAPLASVVDDPSDTRLGILADRLAHARKTRDPQRRHRRLEDLGASLAAADLEAAFQARAGLSVPDRVALVRGIFETLSQGDPATALSDVKRINPGPEQDAALLSLSDQWVEVDENTSTQTRALWVSLYGPAGGLATGLLERQPPQSDLAVLCIEQLVPPQQRPDLLAAAAVSLVKTDPSRAVAYGSELTGQDRIRFDDALLTGWAADQPEIAWQWSNTLDDPTARTAAQDKVITTLNLKNTRGAAARLAELPDSATRNGIVKDVATNYAQINTDDAINWTQGLPAEAAKIAADAINAVAPTGVGARLRVDAQGYAIIDGLLPDMGAALSGRIHAGDRIVGISQGDGSFVDVRQLKLDEIVNQVRGQAGSVVTLQIAPALPDGGFAATTAVPVVRQQIKHH